MAGSATNWMKAPKGSIKRRLFVSNAAMLGWAADIGMDDLSIAEIKATLTKRADTLAPTILKLSGQSIQPAGQAKKKGSDVPDGWASDPVAQALIRRQSIPGSMYAPGAEEAAFLDAYIKANPLVSIAGDLKRYDDYPIGLQAIFGYAGSNYKPINDQLWATNIGDDRSLAVQDNRGDIVPLQQYLLRSLAPFDMTVTRAAGPEHPLYAWAMAAGIGDPYTNKGFDSSSLNPDISGVSGNKLKLRMRIPKGSRGASVNALTGIRTSEQEWLIPANSTWVVTGKSMGADGQIELIVDLIDQRDFDGKVIYP